LYQRRGEKKVKLLMYKKKKEIRKLELKTCPFISIFDGHGIFWKREREGESLTV